MTIPTRYTINGVPWGDCACCDSGKCAAHVEHPDRDPPSRPTTAELVEKIERIWVRTLEERVRYLLADVPTVWAEGRAKGFTEGHAAGRQAAYDGEVTNADISAAFARGVEAMRESLAGWADRAYAKALTSDDIRELPHASPVPEDKP